MRTDRRPTGIIGILRRLLLPGAVILVAGAGTGCQPSTPPAAAAPDPATGLQQPLTSFRQTLTSTTAQLALHPAEETKLPVRVENPGTETWVGIGKYPVTVSYKWYLNGNILPIEGERTVFPGAIGPNQAANVDVRVVAPDKAGTYTLRITLVQEGVEWFMLKSNTFLELPAVVK
jgi:hypothetical protein